ncbi:MAG TPA: helix-turn-helix transcriptional regulator [Pirellulales bacterium]|nr:helix-turn-helix transcriptional regulator [Pirellulales bacterium]
MAKAKQQTLGSRLKQARAEAGWTQEELARHAGLSWSTISFLETGRRTDPPASTIVALCRALHLSADELLGLL